MPGLLDGDATGVSEHLETIIAGDGDDRDAGVLGGAQGECGRHQDCDDDRRTENSSLLDHLDRDPTGQQDGTCIRRHVAAARPRHAAARPPTNLSSGLCRPTSSRMATIPLSGFQNAAA
jgi:hypothetical protein